MTEPTPIEKIKSRLIMLKQALSRLQMSVRLSGIRDETEDLDALIGGLPARIKALREKGYAFGKNLDDRAATLASQWRPIRTNVLAEIQRQTPRLENELRPFESQIAQVQARADAPAAIEATVTRLESELKVLEDKTQAIEKNIRGMFDSYSTQTNTFKTELDRLDWMLQQFAEATFQLLPTEAAVMAVKATFSKDEKIDKDDPEGIFYLTDQRLFFEQKEEKATKKVLFITTAKEKIHQLLFEAPVGLVEQTTASKKGMFGNQDHLALTFKPGAPVYSAWLHLNGQDCNWWQGLIGQARSGGFDEGRAVEIDPEQVRKQSAAPGKCPSCGAPITQVVLRGMNSISCEYCQFVIRL